jgi:hypothetical protein
MSVAISKSGGATERLFPNLVQQRCCKKIRGTIVERESKRGKSNEVTKIVSDLFEIGGTASRRVVSILAGRLDGNLPLTPDRFNMGVAKKLHGQGDLLGAWRKEVVR